MTFSIENFIYFACGVLVSIFLARKFSSRKEIYYNIFSYPVFSRRALSDVDGFEIKFKDAKVEEVWRHIIFVWNGGNQPIWESDLSVANPLRVSFTNDADLSVEEIIGKSDNFTGKLVLKGHEVSLEFPHMDSGQGISFSVLEALRSEDKLGAKPTLEGHIVGLTSAPKEMEPLSRAEVVSEMKFMSGCAVTICLAMLTLGLWFYGLSEIWPPNKLWLWPLGALGFFALVSEFFGVGKYLRAKSLRIPETFDRRGRDFMGLSHARYRQTLLHDAVLNGVMEAEHAMMIGKVTTETKN